MDGRKFLRVWRAVDASAVIHGSTLLSTYPEHLPTTYDQAGAPKSNGLDLRLGVSRAEDQRRAHASLSSFAALPPSSASSSSAGHSSARAVLIASRGSQNG